MKTFMALAGTFALLIFVPMLASARSNRYRGADENDILFFAFFMERPLLQVGICVGAAVLYNVVTYRKNKKSNNVIGISEDAGVIQLELNNIYFNRLEAVSVPVSDLNLKLILKSSDLNGKTSTFQFINNRSGIVIGIIQTDHFIWDKQFKQIRSAFQALQKLGIEVEKVNKRKASTIGGLFK